MRSVLGFVLVICSACGFAQQSGPAAASATATEAIESDSGQPQKSPATGNGQVQQQQSGSISGTVTDQSGALAAGAKVQLTRSEPSQKQEVVSGNDGEFFFSNLPPGPFQLTITAPGFQTKVTSGTLQPGQAYIMPEIALAVAPTTTDVQVGLSTEEIAQEQIKEQEKQRVLGFIPNFYASYVPDAAPLAPKQKFQLAWKSVTDPITFVGAGFLAGIEQAADEYSGYGQGAQGYAKRFGATYSDIFIGTFIDSAILPSLLKQDPRYFYKGTGSTGSRILHALSNAVICKGDNKQWQPNYSAIIGSFITGGISYLYYPASDRSASLLVRNSLIRIGIGGVAGMFQEFVIPKLTPRLKTHPPPQSEAAPDNTGHNSAGNSATPLLRDTI